MAGHRLAVEIKQFRGAKMPSIGGHSLGEQMRASLAGLKQDLEVLRLDASAAVAELSTEVRNGQEGVKRIRAEAAAVKSAFAEIMGNE